MKPRKERLRSKTRLKPTELARGDKPLARNRELKSRGPIKPRRPRVTSAERAARDLLRVRSGGWCEMCGNAPAKEYQHRKPKARGSKAQLWDITNALHVCGHGNAWGCHGLLHTEPLWAVARGYTIEGEMAVPGGVPCLRRGEWVWLTPGGGVEPLTVQELDEMGAA